MGYDKDYYKEYDPTTAEGWIGVGDNYVLMGDFSGAIKYYQKAIDIEPQNTQAHINMANSYYSVNAFNKAINSYREALRNGANGIYIWSCLSRAYANIGLLDEAMDCCRKILEIDPHNSEARVIKIDIIKRFTMYK